MKKRKLSIKTTFFNVISDEAPMLSGILLVVCGCIGITCIPYFCGEIVTGITHVKAAGFSDKWNYGVAVLVGIATVFLVSGGIVYEIKKIYTCVKSCHLPLTEEEIEQLQLVNSIDYWEYIHAQISYSFLGETYYLYSAMERIKEIFIERLVKMLEKELKGADTEYLNKLEKLKTSYRFRNIAQRLKNVGEDIVCQGFEIVESYEYKYVYTIVSETQLCVIPISADDSVMVEVEKNKKGIKRLRRGGYCLKNTKMK